MPPLQNSTALVTGAGSGIGRAIACRLAAHGARVAIVDVDADGARTTEQMIRDTGGTALALVADITDFAAVQTAVRTTRERLAPVQILVNNAGWDRVEPFAQNPPELWDRLIGINLKGPIHCCHAALDDLQAAGGGRIINISSDAARVGSTGEAVYAACKGGIISFSKTLARELARYQITVNVVCPGPTDTPLLDQVRSGPQGARIIEAMTRSIPLRRLGQPDDIAAAVAFFASPEAGFVTGQVLSVSGGLTMVG
jgi:2-hydroxycyclohexanecarboxyl-CoA dehydrogenase